MRKWLLIVLVMSLAQACDAPWAGPTLPAAGHWVSFTTVSNEGPVAVSNGILAATSMTGVEADVVAFETGRHPGYRLDQACPAPCWRLVHADEPGLLYVAVATLPDGCDTSVKEGAAIAGHMLFLIHWVSAPSSTRCDAFPQPRWRLISVSRRDLPGAGTLTIRLQFQGSEEGSAESQVDLS